VISRKLFTKLKAQRLLLEYDDERSGSFEPLKHIPDDKFVVLGLVSTKKMRLERTEDLRRRITEASCVIAHERLGLSPQCGFASSVIGNKISPEIQKRKLELVVNTAQAVWG
jgi:5-methyltetrahydropteroyltriglutamate--homocysteine methyltransferase